MLPTWNDLPKWWHRVMLMVLVSVALCISACTAPGQSSSTPSDMPLIEDM